MWALALPWLKRFGGWILAFFSIFGIIFTFVFAVRRKANSDAEVKYTNQKAADREAIAVKMVTEEREASKVETKTLQEVSNVKTEISTAADSDVDKWLRDEWTRD